jgi:hypothetical protein
MEFNLSVWGFAEGKDIRKRGLWNEQHGTPDDRNQHNKLGGLLLWSEIPGI